MSLVRHISDTVQVLLARGIQACQQVSDHIQLPERQVSVHVQAERLAGSATPKTVKEALNITVSDTGYSLPAGPESVAQELQQLATCKLGVFKDDSFLCTTTGIEESAVRAYKVCLQGPDRSGLHVHALPSLAKQSECASMMSELTFQVEAGLVEVLESIQELLETTMMVAPPVKINLHVTEGSGLEVQSDSMPYEVGLFAPGTSEESRFFHGACREAVWGRCPSEDRKWSGESRVLARTSLQYATKPDTAALRQAFLRRHTVMVQRRQGKVSRREYGTCLYRAWGRSWPRDSRALCLDWEGCCRAGPPPTSSTRHVSSSNGLHLQELCCNANWCWPVSMSGRAQDW